MPGSHSCIAFKCVNKILILYKAFCSALYMCIAVADTITTFAIYIAVNFWKNFLIFYGTYCISSRNHVTLIHIFFFLPLWKGLMAASDDTNVSLLFA